jgi:putative hydrolase of the HAD superfamily
MRPGRAIFFDLDGTLLDGNGLRESIARTCTGIAAGQPGLDAARLVEANGKAWQSYWPEVEAKWMLGALDGASVSLEVWRRTLRACGCDDESVARLALQTHFQHERETHRLFDDVRDLIEGLRQARLPLALITNGASDTQREKLRVLGIERWFDAVVISGEVAVAKPDPAIFGRALDALGVERDHVWHVGDSLLADVEGAKGAGLAAVWLNRSGRARSTGEAEPDVEIRSLAELPGLLARSSLV